MSDRRSPLTPALIGLIAAGVIVVAVLVVLVTRAWQIFGAPAPPTVTPTPSRPHTPRPTTSPTPFPLDALNLQDPNGVSNLYIEYILDASGSMLDLLSDGVPKRDAAKEYLIEHLLTFAPETHFGLRAYGHRLNWEDDKEASCKDIELVAPIEVGQVMPISEWLQDFETLGMTPLHASVNQALEDFETSDPDRLNNLILISDGIETCAGDPCRLVEFAKREGVNFVIHVVGLAVDAQTKAQLSCIADEGGGVYYDVFSSEDLQAALNAIGEDVREEEVIVSYEEATQTAAPPTPTVTETPAPTATTPPTDTPAPTATTAPTDTPAPTSTTPPTDTPTPTRGAGIVGLANPSSVYCSGLGYKEETRETDAGQYGVCIFPDGSECGSWDFLAGRCGVERSYCVQKGHKLRPGDNVGTCFFGDGTSCDEYQYFQGECGPKR